MYKKGDFDDNNKVYAKQQASLDVVLHTLRALDDFSINIDGTTTQVLEIIKGEEDEGIHVNGNRDGLIHLARLVLEVAGKGFDGAHHHFDQVSGADICEVPLIISFKSGDLLGSRSSVDYDLLP